MRQLEAAVAVLEAEQEASPPASTGAPWTPATRSASSAAAVSFESGWPPTAHAKPPAFAWRASSQRVVAGVERPSASTAQQVELTRLADLARSAGARAQPVEQRGRRRAERLLGERDERDVGRRAQRCFLRLQVGERARCVVRATRAARARPRR